MHDQETLELRIAGPGLGRFRRRALARIGLRSRRKQGATQDGARKRATGSL